MRGHSVCSARIGCIGSTTLSLSIDLGRESGSQNSENPGQTLAGTIITTKKMGEGRRVLGAWVLMCMICAHGVDGLWLRMPGNKSGGGLEPRGGGSEEGLNGGKPHNGRGTYLGGILPWPAFTDSGELASDVAAMNRATQSAASLPVPSRRATRVGQALEWVRIWGKLLLATVGLRVNNADAASADLRSACAAGSTPLIYFFISSGGDINGYSSSSGETPLIAAAQAGKPHAVKLLLDEGAEAGRRTAWELAKNRGDSKGTECAEMLQQRGSMMVALEPLKWCLALPLGLVVALGSRLGRLVGRVGFGWKPLVAGFAGWVVYLLLTGEFDVILVKH